MRLVGQACFRCFSGCMVLIRRLLVYFFGGAMCFVLIFMCWHGLDIGGGNFVCGWVGVCVSFVLLLVFWY